VLARRGEDSRGKTLVRRRSRAQETKYRRCGALVLYWENGELVFENFAQRTRSTTDPLACAILHYCDKWKSARDVAAHLGVERESLTRSALQRLCDGGVLERSDGSGVSASAKCWEGWNPAAGFFHFSTKDTKYAKDQRAALEELKRQAKNDPMPRPVKNYRDAPRTTLPRIVSAGEFPTILRERRTWRKFGPEPVCLEGLAQILGLTFGIQGWVDVPGLGKAALKTSPSGGDLHPMEAYVVVRRVKGVRAGIYHYNAESHELEWLREGVPRKALEKNLGNQWWFTKAGFLVVMTAVFGRTRWKYPFPRVYRGVLIEAGHLCQTFCLTATWLGLAPFCTIALTDTQWEEWLGIDGVNESVLYVAGAGTKPKDMQDAHIGVLGKRRRGPEAGRPTGDLPPDRRSRRPSGSLKRVTS
jgi:SagB-type dehydrogenase family enzyme